MRWQRAAVGSATIVGLIVAGLWFARTPLSAPDATTVRIAPVEVPDTARSTGRFVSTGATGARAPAGSAAAGGCGLPDLAPTPRDGVDAIPPVSDKAVDAARREVIARLSQGTDPARRAAGLWLAIRHEQMAAMRTCADEAACTAAIAQPGTAVDRLAALARESDSSTAYALALQACQGGAPRAAVSNFCASLSTERWAQLAPQSAWSWLALAGEAGRRSDVSGVEYAMNQAAQAPDWRAVGAGLAATVIDELPADLPTAPRFALSTEALSAEYSLFGGLQGLINHCPADADPGRRQVCLRLAERMLDRTDNLLGMKIAIRLGERSGVPESRLAALRAEVETLLKLGPMAELLAVTGPAALRCADVARAAAGFERQARLGELAALRERRAESPSRGGSR